MNTVNIPKFTAEASIYQSTATYFTGSFLGGSGDGVAVVRAQFRAKVRRQCGPCMNGKRDCTLWGYDCSVIEGPRGSPDLGIPPGRGRVRCQFEVFEWREEQC